jgi:hypothetical protein
MALGLKTSTPNNNYYSDSTRAHYINFIDLIDKNLFSKITPLSLDNCHLLLTNSFGSTYELAAGSGLGAGIKVRYNRAESSKVP